MPESKHQNHCRLIKVQFELVAASENQANGQVPSETNLGQTNSMHDKQVKMVGKELTYLQARFPNVTWPHRCCLYGVSQHST